MFLLPGKQGERLVASLFVDRANQFLIQCMKPSTAREGKRVQQPKLMDRVDLQTQKDAARGSGVQTPVIYNTVLSPRPMHPPPYNLIILILYIYCVYHKL